LYRPLVVRVLVKAELQLPLKPFQDSPHEIVETVTLDAPAGTTTE
jgi:hypothetical protein